MCNIVNMITYYIHETYVCMCVCVFISPFLMTKRKIAKRKHNKLVISYDAKTETHTHPYIHTYVHTTNYLKFLSRIG